ncbi:MAG: hypothetical protein JWP69_116 [Flaviaesturariibacter sp.]|nr:hypothetical protein [Flaviaesturariibacter sp.]
MKYFLTAILYLMLTSVSCKKHKDSDKLPPITQIGANTFGCLVNGKVWVPKGYNGNGTPNPRLSLDFFNSRNTFSINTYQFENNNPAGFISLSFLDTIIRAGVYTYPDKMNFSVGWEKAIGSCFTQAFDTSVKKWGEAILTKYDNTLRIASGTFNFKFKAQTCDTVYITSGRFDFKF